MADLQFIWATTARERGQGKAARTARACHDADAATAVRAEAIAAAVVLSEAVKFQSARAMVRVALTQAGVAQEIDALVASLLDGG